MRGRFNCYHCVKYGLVFRPELAQHRQQAVDVVNGARQEIGPVSALQGDPGAAGGAVHDEGELVVFDHGILCTGEVRLGGFGFGR